MMLFTRMVFAFSAFEFWRMMTMLILMMRRDQLQDLAFALHTLLYSFSLLWAGLNSLDFIFAPDLHHPAWLIFTSVSAFLDVIWRICKFINPSFHAYVNRLYSNLFLSAGLFASGLWLHYFRYF